MRAGRSIIVAMLALVASCAVPPDRENSRRNALGRAEQAVGWGAGAVAPIRIRSGHTATLLGTNEVLLAGGGSAPKTTEIVRPFEARSIPGPDLDAPRSAHTATMLLSGKVLLAGGVDTSSAAVASAELYDPIARTSTRTGAMAQARRGHAAIRLASGKVLVAGGTSDLTTEIYDPATGTWSAGPTRIGSPSVSALVTLEDGRVLAVGPSAPATTEAVDLEAGTGWKKVEPGFPQTSGGVQNLTRLPNGDIVCGWEGGCAGNLSTITCVSFTNVLGKNADTVADGPELTVGRASFTSVRTVEGDVLFVGGAPAEDGRRVEQFSDPAATKTPSDGTLTAAHITPTATVLTGGDVLVAGGAQATLDRRIAPGLWTVDPFRLLTAREKHGATRLHDGTVLVAGGENIIASAGGASTPVLEAELLDLASKKTKVAGTLAASHLEGTMTTLRDGTVLVAGGGTERAELFTPGAAQPFALVASMSVSRARHSATLLPSGRVLVIGGTDAPVASDVFDPVTKAWTTGPTPANAWKSHGAVLMPNGLVLVVGGGAAEIYDETKNAFRPTTAPGATRDGRTAHLLPSGKVFVAGGSTLSAELFDPGTETWSYTSAQTEQAAERLWTALPSGRLVASGGHLPLEGLDPARRLFDPVAHPTGTFLDLPSAPHASYAHAAALAGTGEAVATGGQPCFFLCFGDTLDSVSVYGDGAPASLRPIVTDVPSTVTAGTKVQIVGKGFANVAEASSGTQASSAVNHPTAVWVSDAGDAVVPSTILDFTDTTATWLVPTTALYGHGLLFVNVAGVFGFGRSVTIAPALAATACENDAQCKTGFCTDGVCCDRRCDGVCEGCSKARKTSGEDGVCGAVPPGKDITGRCVLKLGEVCQNASECGTGFCAQGVCCDSTCDGQCLACNLQGKAGRCSAINEGSCGAACDGDHTLKQIGNEDVSCAPYKCSGPQCNQSCASARDCVAPAVCNAEGKCVPPVAPPRGTDHACGCRAAGAPSSSWPLAAAALGLLLLLRRRRHHHG